MNLITRIINDKSKGIDNIIEVLNEMKENNKYISVVSRALSHIKSILDQAALHTKSDQRYSYRRYRKIK